LKKNALFFSFLLVTLFFVNNQVFSVENQTKEIEAGNFSIIYTGQLLGEIEPCG